MALSKILARFGPGSTDRVSRDEALAYCAQLTATHYENFSVVTWLTPARTAAGVSRASTHFAAGPTTWATKLAIPAEHSSCSQVVAQRAAAMYQGTARHPVMIALAGYSPSNTAFRSSRSRL